MADDAARLAGLPAPLSVDVAFSVRSHERAGDRRTDGAWLEETWARPETRVLVLRDGRFPVAPGGASVAWRPPGDSPPGQRLFLGLRGEVAHFAVVADPGAPAPDDAGDAEPEWAGLRAAGPRLSAEEAGLVVHAVALAEWHASHRFCPRCGGPLEADGAGHVLTCSRCGRPQFPRTDPAVIMLVTDGERALLGRHPRWPPGRYSTLAGFVEPGESLAQAVAREVMEEVGIEVGEVTYVGDQPWPFPASLMVGFFARARTTEVRVDGEEIEDARWLTREEMRREVEDGSLVLPGGISISRSLVQAWYGGPLPSRADPPPAG